MVEMMEPRSVHRNSDTQKQRSRKGRGAKYS